MRLNLKYTQTPWTALNKKYGTPTQVPFIETSKKIKDSGLMFNIIHHAIMEGLDRNTQRSNRTFYDTIKKHRGK